MRAEACESKKTLIRILNVMFSFISRSFTPIPLLEDAVVVEIAKRHSKEAAHVLMKYWIQQNVAVIPKSVNPERVRSNFNVSVPNSESK